MCRRSGHFHWERRIPFWREECAEHFGTKVRHQNSPEIAVPRYSYSYDCTHQEIKPPLCLSRRGAVARGFGHLWVSLASSCKKLEVGGGWSALGPLNRKEREREKSREKRCEKARERWVEVKGGAAVHRREEARDRGWYLGTIWRRKERKALLGVCPPFFF